MALLKSKEKSLIDLFVKCSRPEEKYQKIISLGSELPPFPNESKLKENLVFGCQSTMYLHTQYIDGKLFFKADSEALISKGLASLLIKIYNGESPETILKNPPIVLEKIGIFASLSPNRSNGLNSLYLKMKQEAVKYLL